MNHREAGRGPKACSLDEFSSQVTRLLFQFAPGGFQWILAC
jgi:hypothetical protein